MKNKTKKALRYCFGMFIGNIIVTPLVNRTLLESLLVAIIASLLWLLAFSCLKDFVSFLWDCLKDLVSFSLRVIKVIPKLTIFVIAIAFLFVLGSDKERKS